MFGRLIPRRSSAALPLAILGLLVGAPAALAAGPSAIGTDSDGVSYAGFPGGGQIQRFAGADGSTTGLAPWGTSGTGAGQLGGIVSIDVAPGNSGNVWVLDTNRRVQEFTRNGTYVRGTQLSACTSGVTPDPDKYGGLDVVDNSIYVSHPCANTIQKLNRNSLAVEATQSTGSERPGRLTAQLYYTAPYQTNVVFTAFPAQKKVRSYGLDDLKAEGYGNSVRSYGYTPTDVFVDAQGVLFVGDSTYGRIHQYAANAQGDATADAGSSNPQVEFRYVGGQGSAAGQLNNPEAFDVFDQYSDFAGNLFIADTGNSRVQRMNSFGYSFWAAPASGAAAGGGNGATAPANTTAPAISGDPTVGKQLSCSQGSWTNSPTSYAYSWRRNGTQVATGSTYTLVAADAGTQITCAVTATNASGSSSAVSSAVTPNAAQAAPGNTTRPAISGTAVVGNTLTCSQGSWTGSPTGYAYAWRRGTTQVATGSTYALTSADAGQAVTCVVTATNAAGSSSATSDPVTVQSQTTPPAGGRVGVSINTGAEATNSTGVTLTIREPSGATGILISNDGGFDNPTQVAISGSKTYSWTLDGRGSERRSRTVYVRFIGNGIDGDRTFSDDITLDTTAPTATARTTSTAPTAAKAASRKATVRIVAKDSGTGVQRVEYSAKRGGAAVKRLTVRKAKAFRAKKLRQVRWVRAVDRAGNRSKWQRVKVRTTKRSARSAR